jgi:hypothetical protein
MNFFTRKAKIKSPEKILAGTGEIAMENGMSTLEP